MPIDLAKELATFAAEHRVRPGKPCISCTMPGALRAAVEAERNKGTAIRVLAQWLRLKGAHVGESALGKHFREGHHDSRG